MTKTKLYDFLNRLLSATNQPIGSSVLGYAYGRLWPR